MAARKKKRAKSKAKKEPQKTAERVAIPEVVSADDEQDAKDDELLEAEVGADPEQLVLSDADDVDATDDAEEARKVVDAPTSAVAKPTTKKLRTTGLGDPLARYIQEVGAYPELEIEEERRLARLYRDTGDPEAARLLITANLRLVVKLALMYRRALRNVMDLIQEGNIGLLEALKRFDPEKDVKFSTYASWWIKAYILKFLLDNARLVRVGTTNARRKLLYNLRKEQRKLESEGIEVTPKLLAERFNVSEADVIDVDRALSSRDVSVDAPLGEESSATIGDVMPAPGAAQDEVAAQREVQARIEAAIDVFRETLDERDKTILNQRLVAEDPLTLQQLGDRYGVTREAMRQAEVKLKRRLAVSLRDQLGEEIVLQFSGE